MDEWAFLLERTRASWRASGSPRRVLAAVSGGADSVALLLMLRTLAESEGFFLSAAHVNHGLRPEAGEDATFVAALCGKWDVPCRVLPVRVFSPGENGARDARYAALLAHCGEVKAQALALAHHQRDQAETVLLHLFRGSGGAGLGGMAECRERKLPDGRFTFLWRPFLNVRPETLRQLLSERKIPWREDGTNQSDAYLRNYLRLTVLPAIDCRVSGAQQAIGRTAQVLAAEADYFRWEAERFLEVHACLCPPCRYVDGASLAALHPALARHVVRLACPVPLDFEKTAEVMTLSPGETANLPEGWRALRTAARLHFMPPAAEAPRLGSLYAEPAQNRTGDGIRSQAMPAGLLDACELRFHRPGDRIHPLGGPGEKSIQDYWVDKKMDRPFRPYLPLLCKGSRVVWSIGVGPGEEARVFPGDEAVLVRYEGFLPGMMPGGE